MERIKITFSDVEHRFNEEINKTMIDVPKADICFADFPGCSNTSYTFLIVRRREKEGDFYYALYWVRGYEFTENGIDLSLGLKVDRKCGRALFFNSESYAIYEEDNGDLKLVEWE